MRFSKDQIIGALILLLLILIFVVVRYLASGAAS